MRKLSMVITTYNRYELTLQSFEQVINDDWVDEIVIVDDCSDIEFYNKLKEAVKDMPKVKLFRNEVNLDCYANKREAISKASNEWCILFDSDNIITKEYITILYSQMWVENIALMPEFAQPYFDYRQFGNLYISKENVAKYMDAPMFETCLNCANYFVNRDFYLKVWDGSIDPVTSDSLYQNYNWLLNGGLIHIVEGLQYQHLVHDGSHYKNNVNRTPSGFHELLTNKLKNLK